MTRELINALLNERVKLKQKVKAIEELLDIYQGPGTNEKPLTKEAYEESIGLRGPRGNIDLGTPGEDYNKGGLGDSPDLPGEDSVIAKAQEPNPDSLEGYREKKKAENKELDSRYPVLNGDLYNDAIKKINNIKWDPSLIEDYRAYHYIKGSIINTMKVRGLTSVPLDHHEPNWSNKVIEEYNKQQSI